MELTLQSGKFKRFYDSVEATILVFMELTLQLRDDLSNPTCCRCHNPCFYGINFAIRIA